MQFQQEARSHFVAEIAAVLGEVLLVVERQQVDLAQSRFEWRPSIAQRREAIEWAFSLRIREEVQAVRPVWLTRRDCGSVVRHAENHRKGRVEFQGMQEPKSGYMRQRLGE